MEDQFIDPDDNDADNNLTAFRSLLDELDKYLKMVIDVQLKQPNLLQRLLESRGSLVPIHHETRVARPVPDGSLSWTAGLVIDERRSSLNPDTVENRARAGRSRKDCHPGRVWPPESHDGSGRPRLFLARLVPGGPPKIHLITSSGVNI
ncbi:unnamed protein product [Didymodactylos carnosus]|uniref:Uncharacterized protein n=1 Tax=Didymodactylos carnosus TaxID=1234261 RepID=A0A8S2EEM5_9BILA|nr:unnamed protein product [Didymodactylos carnosus]